MNKFVKLTFSIVASVLTAMILYNVLIASDNSMLTFACRAIERPIAFSYFEYAYYPSVHILDDLDEKMAGSGNLSTYDVSDLENSDSDNLSYYSTYSIGWN